MGNVLQLKGLHWVRCCSVSSAPCCPTSLQPKLAPLTTGLRLEAASRHSGEWDDCHLGASTPSAPSPQLWGGGRGVGLVSALPRAPHNLGAAGHIAQAAELVCIVLNI